MVKRTFQIEYQNSIWRILNEGPKITESLGMVEADRSNLLAAGYSDRCVYGHAGRSQRSFSDRVAATD